MMPAYIAHITPRDGVVRRLLADAVKAAPVNGALMTGASAAGYAGMTQQQIVQRCLTNRGYAVLD